jgi:hypothetical protein
MGKPGLDGAGILAMHAKSGLLNLSLELRMLCVSERKGSGFSREGEKEENTDPLRRGFYYQER